MESIVQQKSTTPHSDLGIRTSKPKYPHYSAIAKREESFKDAGSNFTVSIENLTEAGLVYTGVGDSVRCFYCGGGLRNWDRGDDPWEEHAKWYPHCEHVILVKGQRYIEKVLRGERPETDSANSLSSMKSEATKEKHEPDLFSLPATLALLEMGYEKDEIQDAVTVFKQRHTGNVKFKGEDICQILYEFEENPSLRNQIKCEPDNKKPTAEKEEDISKLTEENHRLKENNLCKICLDGVADIILLPCGHIVSCGMCAPSLTKCPVCRKVVGGVVKAYFALASEVSQ